MFKAGIWRSDKNKIKAVFKLHFHATQLSQVGADALMISIVPVDVGKPTLKLEKATIQDGGCYWENPVQETVKFSQDPKTGKISEKIYNFVVSNGSSKAGFVGEASIDFATYAASIKTSSVSLSLKNAKGNAVLHVSIQRLQENLDQREAEEIEKDNINYNERSLKAQLSITDADGTVSSNSADDEPINKVNPQIVDLNGNRRASSVSELTLSSSGSSSELLIPRDFSAKSQLSLLHKTISDVSSTSQEERLRSRWEWLGGPAPEISTDESISINCEEGSNTNIEKLKSELAALLRQAELSDLELQTLRKQIVKESKKGQDLLKEVASLKEERDLFKEECENLKAIQKHIDEVKMKEKLKFEGGEWDPLTLLEELRQELCHEKGLNANLRIQLEKTQESNSELILAVRDLDEMLEKKDKEMSTCEKNEVKSESEDEEQKALDELVKDHTDIKDAHILETKIRDLCNELEICYRDKDDLEAQMEQISLDYEIMKQENHDLVYKLEQSQLQEQLKMQYECSSPYTVTDELENNVESLENQLKTQSNELSDSLNKVMKLENHVKVLEEEMEKRTKGFEADLEIITHAKVEEEKKAIQAEENLRKMKWQNGKTAERLRDEFKKLSVQMASTFEENEKLALKAVTQADELRLEKRHLEDMLKKSKDEIQWVKDLCEEKLFDLSQQLSLKIQKIDQLENERKQSEENFERKFEIMRNSMQKMETERREMESVVDLLRMEMGKSIEELEILRRLKDGKELIVGNLEKELEVLKSECDEMKGSLSQDEFEKEKLRKQVFQLKGELKKKEEALSGLEKKLKDGSKISSKNNNKCAPPSRATKEVANLKDKIKLLEGQIKLKELALGNSTNRFLEKEKDLYHKIDGLETRLEELVHNTASFCEYDNVKIVKDSEEVISNGSVLNENGVITSVIERSTGISMERSLDGCNETELLREKNKAMEVELKEMQERYSEISLKFAEVEGERQQLVMTVRNLKNVKRSQ